MIEWTLTVIVTYGLETLLVAWHNVTFIFSGDVVVVVAVSVLVTVKSIVGVLVGVTGVPLGVAVAVVDNGLQPLARID